MRKRTLPGLALAALLVVLFAGGSRTATAAPSAGILYRFAGQNIGLAQVTVAATSMQVQVTLKGASPRATYKICVNDPSNAQEFLCPSAGALVTFIDIGFGMSVPLVGASNGPVSVAGTVTTDVNGAGDVTITVSGVLPVAVITITNSVAPSDSARSLIVTGATGPGTCLPGAPIFFC